MKKLFTTVILLGMLLPSVCAKTDKDKFSGYLLSTSRDSGSSSHTTADLPDGTSYSRSVIAEPMYYNTDGTIRCIPPTAEGVKEIK